MFLHARFRIGSREGVSPLGPPRHFYALLLCGLTPFMRRLQARLEPHYTHLHRVMQGILKALFGAHARAALRAVGW